MTLAEWKQRNEYTSRRAAEVLGVGRETFNSIVSGAREPLAETALRIEHVTRQLNPRAVVHAWEMLKPETRTSIYGEKGRP